MAVYRFSFIFAKEKFTTFLSNTFSCQSKASAKLIVGSHGHQNTLRPRRGTTSRRQIYYHAEQHC